MRLDFQRKYGESRERAIVYEAFGQTLNFLMDRLAEDNAKFSREKFRAAVYKD